MATNAEFTSKSATDSSKEKAADWNVHEHVTPQTQLEAEKLVDLVGNPELAKQAISAVDQKQSSSKDTGSDLAASLVKSRQASTQISEAFLKSLSDLETSLATPVVAGELTQWITAVLTNFEQVKSMLLGDVAKIHEDLFTSIVRQNVDLSSQVEKLRAADEQISHAECDEMIASLKQIQSEAIAVRQDEAKLTEKVSGVSKRAIEFVIAARGQETAISSWLSEAFNRDLGSGD